MASIGRDSPSQDPPSPCSTSSPAKPAEQKEVSQVAKTTLPREQKADGKIQKERVNLPNADDLPLAKEHFKEELKLAHEKQGLKSLERGFQAGSKRVPLGTIEGSQNPVAKVETPLFVSYSALEKEAGGQTASKGVQFTEADLKAWCPDSKLWLNVEYAIRSTPGNVNTKLSEAIKVVEKKIVKSGQEEKSKLENYLEKLKGLKEPEAALTLKGVAVYYKKSDILNSLRTENSHAQNNESIRNAIVLISQHPSDYLDEGVLDRLKQIDLPKGVFERIKANNHHARLALGSEVLMVNKDNPKVKELLSKKEEAKYIDKMAFAFKQGLENTREILFAELFEALGTGKYVVRKTNTHLKQAQIHPNDQLRARMVHNPHQMEALTSPEGLASRWLEGKKMPLELWNGYHNAKKALAQAEFEKKPETDIAELKKKCDTYAAKIAEYGGQNSVSYHCVNDALICHGDGHLDQYLSENGEYKIYDVARGLPPSSCTRVYDDVFAMLKSDMLGHPFAKLPLPEEQIKTILSWDLEALEAAELKHVGTDKGFQEVRAKIREITADADKGFMGTEEELKGLFKKYGAQNEAELKLKLISEGEKQTKILFSQIHPNAYLEFKNRRKALQEYVRKTPQPTPEGAFQAMYPHFVPFIRVLERMEGNPYMALAGNPIPIPLQDIIEKAKTVASAEEIAAMQAALKALTDQAKGGEELATTTLGLVFRQF